MGGQYTEKVEPAAAGTPAPETPQSPDIPIPGTAQESVTPSPEAKPEYQEPSLEFHIKGAEAHFHDRTSGLKVAVPVAEWYAAWKRIRHGGEWHYFDSPRMTYLSINVSHGTYGERGRRIAAIIHIQTVEGTSKAYQALDNFFVRAITGDSGA